MSETNEIEKGSIGSNFDDFLMEEGLYEGAVEYASKRVLAFKLAALMKELEISQAELARRMDTSRKQVSRILDPKNDGITLGSLDRAITACGKRLLLSIV